MKVLCMHQSLISAFIPIHIGNTKYALGIVDDGVKRTAVGHPWEHSCSLVAAQQAVVVDAVCPVRMRLHRQPSIS